jgi:hypothetical protein
LYCRYNLYLSSHITFLQDCTSNKPTKFQWVEEMCINLFVHVDLKSVQSQGLDFHSSSIFATSVKNLCFMKINIFCNVRPYNFGKFIPTFRRNPQNLFSVEVFFFIICGVGLTSPGTAATSGLLYSPRW